jgi:predicted ATPase
MINTIKLTNLLSYGPDSPELELRPLNVLIGPNGSGKSNLIEAIGLLRATPTNFAQPVKSIEGGGVREWIWKGGEQATEAAIEVTIANPQGRMSLRHRLCFGEHGNRFELRDEAIENERPYPGKEDAYFYYRFQSGQPVLNVRQATAEAALPRLLRREDIHPEQSILSQRKDPDQYPELFWLSGQYEKVRIYDDWAFGRTAPQRLPQPTDGRTDFLTERMDNLGLILNSLMRRMSAREQIRDALQALFEGIEDFGINVEVNTAQVYLMEAGREIPSTRLSDGTMRYICLLAILCHPSPPPLVCIEEPELGLHPDVLPKVAGLLKEASQRTQLIVTTHSDMLVDALSDCPEDVVVCEKSGGQSHLRRLQAPDLTEWMKTYSLGQLWRDGVIGGNRW